MFHTTRICILFFSLTAVLFRGVNGEDYIRKFNSVHDITCLPGSMEVKLRDNSALANASWAGPNNTTSAFIESATGKKVGCSAFIAHGVPSPAIVLNYTCCDVAVIQPEGGDGYVQIKLKATIINLPSADPGPVYTFAAHCTYASHVTQDAGATVTVPSGGGSGGGGDHGGSAGSTVKGLEAMWFHVANNKNIEETVVNLGDSVKFMIVYKEHVYEKLLPTDCYISDARGSGAKQKINFVYGSCPAVYDGVFLRPNLTALFFSEEIKAVRFRGSSELWAHCTLSLCIRADNPMCQAAACWNTHAASFVDRIHRNRSKAVFLADSTGSGSVYAGLTIRDPDDGGGEKANSVATALPKSTIVAGVLGIFIGAAAVGLVVLAKHFIRSRSAKPPMGLQQELPYSWSIPRPTLHPY